MDDAELNAIRKARLAELQRNSGTGASGTNNSSTANSNNGAGNMISQFLQTKANERLSRVRMVRPERVQAVEDYILKLVQNSQLNRKLSEDEIVNILNSIAREQDQNSGGKLIFDRKNAINNYSGIDEDDDDDFFD